MDDGDIFRKSRALKNISTSTKTYVRDVADILRAVINPAGRPHPWERFSYEKAGSETTCCYATFQEYLDEWSRLTLDQLRDLFCHDIEVSNLLDVATQRPPGAGKNQYTDSLLNNVQEAPAGNSKDAGLRRLRKDRADLHQLVLDGEMTVHAAMVQAGFRKVKSPLENLMHWWGKADDRERSEFTRWLHGA